eukprot:5478766-Pyramimonas_sp.AAC.1
MKLDELRKPKDSRGETDEKEVWTDGGQPSYAFGNVAPGDRFVRSPESEGGLGRWRPRGSEATD